MIADRTCQLDIFPLHGSLAMRDAPPTYGLTLGRDGFAPVVLAMSNHSDRLSELAEELRALLDAGTSPGDVVRLIFARVGQPAEPFLMTKRGRLLEVLGEPVQVGMEVAA